VIVLGAADLGLLVGAVQRGIGLAMGLNFGIVTRFQSHSGCLACDVFAVSVAPVLLKCKLKYMQELLQVEMQNTQCENEAFVNVFGKEYAGYVRSMGRGITPSQISSRSTRLASSSIEANEKMLKMQAEIDSLKEKASEVDVLKAQVALLMQMQSQNSRDKEVTFTSIEYVCHNFGFLH
jgi:hypothetical protein